ncbi:hypothetical protein Tco_1356584, partial [Tanacetum coccineum]
MATTPTIREIISSRMFPQDSKVGRPKEILATELHLQLPPPPPLIGAPKRENLDRYCDYHGEKGNYTNEYFQLKRKLEAALESGKLNHLVKDVRQRGGNRGKQTGNSSVNGKIINMVYERGDSRKRKFQKRRDEDLMDVPIRRCVRRTADNRGGSGRLFGPESIYGSRRSCWELCIPDLVP